MSATADALMGIFGFKRVEGDGMRKSVEEVRRAAFRKIFANPPYEFSMARHTEDSTSWPGNYVAYHVECAWQAFNAALDSVCVEFPSAESVSASDCPRETLRDCRAAIEAAGLGLRAS